MVDFKITLQGPPARAIYLRALFIGWAMAALALLPPAGQAQTFTATVNVGGIPAAVAVNPVTNKTYVASGPITVMDGATNAITSIYAVGFPVAVAVNPVTNKIYFADKASNLGRFIVIDGATNAITNVTDPNANKPVALALNPLTNKIYVANALSNNCDGNRCQHEHNRYGCRRQYSFRYSRESGHQ
jgi:hypothetical protein